MPFSNSSWDVQAAAGEPCAVVRVRNLQTTLGAGAAQDAWGRSGRPQPAQVSAEVVLAAPFDEAAGQDRVAADTVHYGSLSKALLKSVAQWDAAPVVGDDAGPGTLRDVLQAAWRDLTGTSIPGHGAPDGANAATAAAPTAATAAPPALLQADVVRRLTLTVLLPKASLAGAGVSLTATGLLAAERPTAATALRLHGLRVATLVGVHPHERTARQAVVADVALDAYDGTADEYTQLEQLVVQTVERSSFDTLEALATHVARTILAEFRPQRPAGSPPAWSVHVALEKPLAVPFADAPVVEVRMGGGRR